VAGRALVEAAQRGEHDAFEALAIGAGDRLFAIARLILRDVGAAEDAVQETLVHAWRDLHRLRDPERFDAWVHRLLVNACADQGRLRRRRSVEVAVIHDEPSTEDGVAAMADRDQLERGFRRLKLDQRVAVVLHYYLGLTAAEVADMLGIPVGTAKSRIHYGTETLRAALEADARGAVAATNGRPA
jgi:RNA polymerase sigma-70 factor (ECF subfamily)